MPDPEPGGVVRVPFPCCDREARQHRPARAGAQTGPTEDSGPLLWRLRITPAENRGRAGDVAIPDAAAAGLPFASVIRCARIAAMDAVRAEVRRRAVPETRTEVEAGLPAILAVS